MQPVETPHDIEVSDRYRARMGWRPRRERARPTRKLRAGCSHSPSAAKRRSLSSRRIRAQACWRRKVRTVDSVMAFRASTKVGISRILATPRPRKSPISRTWCSKGRSRIRACGLYRQIVRGRCREDTSFRPGDGRRGSIAEIVFFRRLLVLLHRACVLHGAASHISLDIPTHPTGRWRLAVLDDASTIG
jgi:hypothetical protein